jgi:succinate dehydrogenase/fumarate reductase cytochrome b subunit
MDESTTPTHAHAAGTESRWRRAQAIAGLVLASFLSLHLLNVIAALVPGGYDAVQRVLRAAYQFPPIELALFGALGVHLVAGVRAMVKRRGKRLPASARTRVQRFAAWALLVFITGHVLATRGSSLFEGVYPGAAGLAFTFQWVPAYFWPYYPTLAVAGAVHMGLGVPLALGMIGRPAAKAWMHGPRMASILAPTAVILVLGVLGLAGVLYALPSDPLRSDYAEMYRRMGAPWVPDAR